MKAKAADRIKLSDGTIMTLGEALDRGLMVTGTAIGNGRKYELSLHYLAKEKNAPLFWEIGQKLFESRGGVANPAHVKAHLDSKK